jgi:hypothetical protein
MIARLFTSERTFILHFINGTRFFFDVEFKNLKAIRSKEVNLSLQQGAEMLRFPHFLDIRLTDGSKFVSLTRRQPFTPVKATGRIENL